LNYWFMVYSKLKILFAAGVSDEGKF